MQRVIEITVNAPEGYTNNDIVMAIEEFVLLGRARCASAIHDEEAIKMLKVKIESSTVVR